MEHKHLVNDNYMYLFKRKFTLQTDHKPLLKTFSPDSATPVLAAAHLQRWSLLLSSYRYKIEFKPAAEVASSDALSRLPLQYRKDTSVEDKILWLSEVQLCKHPTCISVLEIARQLNCQKSSPSKDSCNDPKWLTRPLLHHS